MSPEFRAWLDRLGLTRDVRARLHAASHDEARALLPPLQTEAKWRYRVFARAVHPDAGGHEDDLKALNLAWEMIEGLTIPEPPPPLVELEERAPAIPVVVSGNWIRLR